MVPAMTARDGKIATVPGGTRTSRRARGVGAGGRSAGTGWAPDGAAVMRPAVTCPSAGSRGYRRDDRFGRDQERGSYGGRPDRDRDDRGRGDRWRDDRGRAGDRGSAG